MIICLDPGHGGRDPGAIANGCTESALNLGIARLLRTHLQARGHTVVMTRDDGRELTLEERCRISNEAGAALFISLHCNAGGQPSANGYETWHYRWNPKSRAWAEKIHPVVKTCFTKDRGIRDNKFYVLVHTKAPAVLLECGFVTNPEDAKNLSSIEWRTNLAATIAKAIG